MDNPVIQTDIADLLGEIRQELKSINDRLGKLEVGQAEIKGDLKYIDEKLSGQIKNTDEKLSGQIVGIYATKGTDWCKLSEGTVINLALIKEFESWES